MPSLNKAREQAKRTVCVSNLKSLNTVWLIYASDNDGMMVSGQTGGLSTLSSDPPEFRLNYVNNRNGQPNKTWVGYFGLPANMKNLTNFQKEAMKACVDLGALWEYNDSYDIYRCPTGKEYETRTYSIVDSMNGHAPFHNPGGNPPTIVYLKVDNIRQPAERMVFIDEGYASSTSWTIHPTAVSWWDKLPVRHNNGCTFSFADGHADYAKWDDPKTVDFFTDNSLGNSNGSAAADNVDFQRMQRACWGRYVGN